MRWRRKNLGRLLESGFNRSASNRHNRALKTIGNRICHAIWSIGQCGQSANRPSFPIGQSRYLFNVANRAMSSIYWQDKYVWKMSNFYEGWRQIGKSYQLRLIGTSYRHSWLEKTHTLDTLDLSIGPIGNRFLILEYWNNLASYGHPMPRPS